MSDGRDSVAGTVYVLHFDPPYRHAAHYVGWTAGDVDVRIATHVRGAGSPLVRAAVAAGVSVRLAGSQPGSRALERRLKRWHKTTQFCPICRQRRGGTDDRDDSGSQNEIADKPCSTPDD